MANPDRGADQLDEARCAHAGRTVSHPRVRRIPTRSYLTEAVALWNCSLVAVSPWTAAMRVGDRPSSFNFFANETVEGCGGPNGASLFGTKKRSPWNTTRSAGSQAITISFACGFGPMSMSSSLRVLSSSTRLPFSSSRNSGFRGLA